MASARPLALLAVTALANAALYANWLLAEAPPGKMIGCAMKPCLQRWPLVVAFAVSASTATAAAALLRAILLTPTGTAPPSGSVLGMAAVGTLVSNVLIDAKYMHPIPHAAGSLGSLHWMWRDAASEVSFEDQAVSPMVSVIISVANCAMCLLCMRNIADRRAECDVAKAKAG